MKLLFSNFIEYDTTIFRIKRKKPIRLISDGLFPFDTILHSSDMLAHLLH